MSGFKEIDFYACANENTAILMSDPQWDSRYGQHTVSVIAKLPIEELEKLKKAICPEVERISMLLDIHQKSLQQKVAGLEGELKMGGEVNRKLANANHDYSIEVKRLEGELALEKECVDSIIEKARKNKSFKIFQPKRMHLVDFVNLIIAMARERQKNRTTNEGEKNA